jgi:predicted metal-binding protein
MDQTVECLLACQETMTVTNEGAKVLTKKM